MKAKVLGGFLALCLWAGSSWLYDLFCPGVLSGLPRTALHNGLVALGCLGWALWKPQPSPAPRVCTRLAVGGSFLFALPEIVLAVASAHVTQSTETLVFMLVPVVVVFCVGQQSAGFGTESGSMRGLVPALTGLGAAALILPFELPSSPIGRLWLGALVVSAVAAGVAAVGMHRLVADVSLAQAGSAIFGVSCLATAIAAFVDWSGVPPCNVRNLAFEALRLLLIDGPILLLGLWLLRKMQPVAFSSRLMLVPAVTLLEGIVAERPDVGLYGWLGMALTIGATFILLRESGTNERDN
jgi:drug/metabolite transporter (DMT)-like permease